MFTMAEPRFPSNNSALPNRRVRPMIGWLLSLPNVARSVPNIRVSGAERTLEKERLIHRSGDARSLKRARAGRAAIAALLISGALGCGRDAPAPESKGGSVAATPTAALRDVPTEHPVVSLETNQGVITIRLNGVLAPLTVRNFVNYVNDGFYSNTLIHYVSPDQMIVGGGYAVDGTPKSPGPSIRNEAHNGLKNVRGTIAMARDVAAGIDSATSQFFINLVDAPEFDHRGKTSEDYGYCVFGEIEEGLEVADRISQWSTRDHGGDLVQLPDPPVIITSVRVVR
jgi:cyclophilin family peptidyl-prolyl cis-trans isomerase